MQQRLQSSLAQSLVRTKLTKKQAENKLGERGNAVLRDMTSVAIFVQRQCMFIGWLQSHLDLQFCFFNHKIMYHH